MIGLTKFSDAELKQELEQREQERRRRLVIPDSPVGWWKVSTEGDCEGKSTRDLGLHYGHIGDIALALAGASYYALSFSPASDPRQIDETGNRRETALIGVMQIANISSNTLNDQELDSLRKFFGPKWKLSAGNYYQSVRIEKK
jgi:hypothetical protein